MKHFLLFLSLFLCITSIHCVKWEDCGIPLTRKIYYQNVVVSPSKLNIVDQSTDRSISINVNVNLQNYKLDKGVDVNLQVLKDGAVFLDSSIGDLCNLLTKANQVSCPLPEGAYSFSYLYQLPPLMTANYTVRIVATEISGAESRQIGCVAATIPVIGLGADACSYKSTLAATFAGTAQYLDNNNVIQVGPYGPGGIDLGYTWGTFVSITASPDLVGYSMRPDNYVWGLRLTQNGTRFTGTMVLGYRPNATALPDAQLVYQGFCDWKMKASPYATFEFEEGTCEFAPTYYFPAGFPYPLNLGNLGVLPITKSGDGYHFSVVASKSWCRCNCNLGGVGRDDTLNGGDSKDDSMSGFRKATIAIAVIGSFILVVAIIVIIKLRRAKPRPVVYDEADLMDPQKPDYGTIAIGEAFEAENQEYN